MSKALIPMKPTLNPPTTLSTEARVMWADIQSEYSISDSGGIVVLTAACEAFDRLRKAQALIKAEGMVTTDRFGQSKQHPAIVIERDARGQMLAALKQLHLDLEPLRDRPGRPNGPHIKLAI